MTNRLAMPLILVAIGFPGARATVAAGEPAAQGATTAARDGANPAPAGGDAVQAVPTPARKPGHIVGRVSDERGRAIRGGTVKVVLSGTTFAAGTKSEFSFDVEADGTYDVEVPDGLYKIWAYVWTEYEGRKYKLALHPEDGREFLAGHNSKPGVVKNFLWKLSGARPGHDTNTASAFYGGAIRVGDGEWDDEKRLKARYPGSTVVLTLTPTGRRLDGSEGKVVEKAFPVASIYSSASIMSYTLADVPLGAYTARARLVTQDKAERPLWVRVKRQDEKPAKETKVIFAQPSLVEELTPLELYVSE